MSFAAFRQGAREASGVPAAVLIAGFLGFGALAAAHQIPFSVAVASTAMIWALPGAISLAVFAFNLFGDSLRDALDPRLPTR